MLICESLTSSGKRTSFQNVSQVPETTFSRLGKRGNMLHLTFLLLRRCNPTLSLTRLQKQDTRLMGQIKENFCLREYNWAKLGVTFFSLAFEVLGGKSPTFKKTLKRLAVLSDNPSFHGQALSVAFCKLIQSSSITAIRRSAAILLARAP